MAQAVDDSGAEVQRLEERLSAQESQLQQLQGLVRRLVGGPASQPDRGHSRSRRDILRLAGAGVVGAAGAAALIPKQARAADGSDLVLGNNDSTTNTADTTTELAMANAGTTTGVPGFYADTSNSSSGTTDGIWGTGSNTQGVDTAGGNGVVGFSGSYGIGAAGLQGGAPYSLLSGFTGSGVLGAGEIGGIVGFGGELGGYFVTEDALDLKAGGTGRFSQWLVGQLAGHYPGYLGTYFGTGTTPASGAAYELVRGENGEIWAALYDPTLDSTNSNNDGYFWKRVNSPRFDNPVGDGSTFIPFRAYDSRVSPGHPIATGSIVNIQIAPHGSSAGPSGGTIPATAVGIAGNLTAVSPTAGGYLTIYPGPSNSTRPGTSTVNFVAGGAPTPNGFIVGLGSDGTVNVYVFGPSGQSVHVVVDVTAYIQ